jgi:periplasmic divalent cation tolerance protein
MSVVFVYVTVPFPDEAEKLAHTIVSERLAACANILPDMISIYNWRGKTGQRKEAVIIFKTQEKLCPELEKRIKSLHQDDTPCIVTLPIAGGNDAFLQWVKTETGS